MHTDDEILEVLKDQNASFRHAINLRDFRAYCQAGRQLTRQEVDDLDALTPFDSDEADKARGLFAHHFGNLSDFGAVFFHSGSGRSIPNIYGPITIEWPASALDGWHDAAITRESAFSADYDRSKMALPADELARAFTDPERGYLDQEYNFVEVSFRHGNLQLADASRIIAEPIFWGASYEGGLAQAAREAAQAYATLVEKRDYIHQGEPRSSLKTLQELAIWAAPLQGAIDTSVPPSSLKEYIRNLPDNPKSQLQRWARYTYNGTLQLLDCD